MSADFDLDDGGPQTLAYLRRDLRALYAEVVALRQQVAQSDSRPR